MHRNIIETVLGAVVLLVAGIFLLFALQFSSSASVKGFDLIGEFRHIDGLKLGDEVRMAGIRVGSVAAVTLRPEDYTAIVTMRMEPNVEVSTDSTVSIHTDGLFGGKYLEIQIGGETTNMKAGQRFGFVQDAVIVEELIEKIVAFAEGQRAKKPEDKPKASP
jgi:phospholipid/cholesterol/gamma-HCH transport system substrate-binding protein